MSTPVKIHTNGSYTVKRNPELCDVHLNIEASGPDPSKAFDDAGKAAAKVAEIIRPLAAPKVEDQSLDVEDELRDPSHPVSAWKMQQVRTWSRDPDDDHRPPPPAPRVMMAVAAAAPEPPKKIHYAQVKVTATFHNFDEMTKVVSQFAQLEHVQISNLGWRVTKATEAQLKTRVTQGAYEDALATAKDVAAVVSGNAPRPVDVNCHGFGSSGMGRMCAAPAAEAFGRQHRSEPEPVSFVPEPVSINGNVNVEWAVDP